MNLKVSLAGEFEEEEVIRLYRANGWSSADKPAQLMAALRNMLVHPAHRGKGLGRLMMQSMLDRYAGFHQMMLTPDGGAIDFYKAMGFERAGKTEPMCIYAGNEH